MLELRHLRGKELQEGFVPYRPHSVEVLVAIKSLVGIIFSSAEIISESRLAGKGFEAHRPVIRSVEEGGIITLVLQLSGYPAHVVHGCGSKEERLDKHRNARQDTRHSVDTLPAVAIGVEESLTMLHQRVNKWSVSLVFSTVEPFVISSDILAPKTLHYQNHNVLL